MRGVKSGLKSTPPPPPRHLGASGWGCWSSSGDVTARQPLSRSSLSTTMTCSSSSHLLLTQNKEFSSNTCGAARVVAMRLDATSGCVRLLLLLLLPRLLSSSSSVSQFICPPERLWRKQVRPLEQHKSHPAPLLYSASASFSRVRRVGSVGSAAKYKSGIWEARGGGEIKKIKKKSTNKRLTG